MAAIAFQQLGTNAQGAAPALIDIASQNISSPSRNCAVRSLGGIGPAAREAVPILMGWSTNADLDFRNEARRALLRIDPEVAARVGITNGT